MPFKLIVAGSRGFDDYDMLKATLDHLLQNKSEIMIVSGTAKGADILGERYAKEKGYSVNQKPADWKKHGKKAGYMRNEEMALFADACVVFWDGVSKGTKHMINLANKYDLPLRIIRY